MDIKDYILTYCGGWSVITCLVLFTATFLWVRSRRPRDLPPGPTPFPLIGNISCLFGGDFLKTIASLKEKYGHIYSLSIGPYWAVFINDSKLLRDVLVKHGDKFNDRPADFVFKTLLERKGISSSNGNVWKHKRNCSLKALKHFGFGKKSMESKIIEEIQCFLKDIEEIKGASICIENTLRVAVSNITCSIVFGKRFTYTDHTFVKLIRDLDDIMTNPFIPVVNWMPFLHKISKIWDVFGTHRSINLVKDWRHQMATVIQEHVPILDKNNPRDFIDAYLVEDENHNAVDNSQYRDDSLEGVLLDLFTAGTETTSTTLLWAVLFLVCNQDVQETLYEELMAVVGSHQQPLFEHKDKLPYCEAFIYETQRLGNIFPLSLPRTPSVDVVIGGYRIPKRTVVIPNFDSVMHDERIFPNSKKFDPCRFLNNDGTLNNRRQDFFPYSLGRRVCLGESLARMELFLFVTSIVIRFKILPAEDQSPLILGKIGTTYSPMPFKVRFVVR